jgi:micrococcal nuclease
MKKTRKNQYYGTVISVVDGDTFDIMIDLGFEVLQKFRVRLDGIDTPEKNTEEGKAAKQFVKDLIENKYVLVTDVGNEKYGRARAKINLETGEDLTEYLIERNIGIEYHGGKKQIVSSLSIIE